MSTKIPKNQLRSVNAIHQDEHEDSADAKRIIPVDELGDFLGVLGNPIHVTGELISSADAPLIANIAIPIANTEQSYAFPDGTSKFTIKVRGGNAIMKYAWTSGESGTNYITIGYGEKEEVNDVRLVSKTLYFQVSKAGQTVEIQSWS